METDRYRRIAEILAGALDRHGDGREEYLDTACAGDEGLRDEIRVLLEESSRSSVFIAPSTHRGGAPWRPGPRALPERIGSYRILSVLGAGGMGEVYLAEQERPQRRVALKVMRAGFGSDSLEARFRHEAELLGRVQHPGVAQVYEAGIVEDHDGPCPFIAMQYIEGASLGAGRGLPAGDGSRETPRTRDEIAGTLVLVEKVARALHAAHKAGVVHRDIKPQNIIVTPEGEPVVVDFGVARDLSGELQTLTNTGEQPGTPAYMSPEQVDGHRRAVDTRTDVWSLGIVLWELLCGRRPFDRPNRSATLDAIARDPLPDPRRENPRIPSDLAVVMATALERNLGRRYLAAGAFADELRRVRLREPILARPAPAWLRLWRWVQRHPALAGSLAATILCLAAGLAVTLHQLRVNQEMVLMLQEEVDSRLLSEFEASSRKLWPEVPETVPRIDAWLAEAGALQRKLDGYEALRASGVRRTALDQIVAGAAAFRRLGETVSARRARAIGIGKVSLEDSTAAWEAFGAALKADPRFAGTAAVPRAGLVPLGRDAHSGFWEFWHVGSGDRPRREGDFESGKAVIDDGSGIVLVLLPGGTVAQKYGAGDPVALAPFLIAKHELTLGQWLRVMDGIPSGHAIGKAISKDLPPITARHPLTEPTWDQAAEAATRLGLDLPTVAQWDHAALAGTTTDWWSGDAVASLVGCENIADEPSAKYVQPSPTEKGIDDGFRMTAPVGSLRPNPFGLHDVQGNVSEWCREQHYGRCRPGDGLMSEIPIHRALLRGGNCGQPAGLARSGQGPQNEKPVWSRTYLGVRLALNIR